MSELWIVLQREFLERARSRSYLVSTLLTPLFVALFFLVPVLLDPGPPPPPRIAVVDESGVGLGEAVEAALGAAEPAAEVGLIRRPLALVEDSLATLLALGAGVDGLLWIPPDALRRGAATYRFRSAGARALEGRISLALSGALVEARLRGLGMDPAVAAATFAPARLRSTPVGAEAEPGADGAGLLFAMMVGLALYFLILLYGVQVMQSVQEEKSNRIAEVLVSSIRASHLMLGKVLGVGLAALLQVAVWTAVTALLVRRREAIAELLGGRADLLAGIPAPPATAATGAMVAFAVLGFFLYASLFAAAGAAAASTEDA